MDVVTLENADFKEAARVIASSFQACPFAQFVAPDERSRHGTLCCVYRAVLRYCALNGDVLGLKDGNSLVGVAGRILWDQDRRVQWRALRTGMLTLPFRLDPRCFRRLWLAGQMINRLHQQVMSTPHLYFQVVCLNPAYQGRAVSRFLARDLLSIAEEKRLPCYLETQEWRNVALFRHFGFEVAGEGGSARDGLSVWGMVRPCH